jgi:hypothetical protein
MKSIRGCWGPDHEQMARRCPRSGGAPGYGRACANCANSAKTKGRARFWHEWHGYAIDLSDRPRAGVIEHERIYLYPNGATCEQLRADAERMLKRGRCGAHTADDLIGCFAGKPPKCLIGPVPPETLARWEAQRAESARWEADYARWQDKRARDMAAAERMKMKM